MSDLEYVNARLRAMRAKLLKSSQYETLLGLDNLEAFEAWLGSSSYGSPVQGSEARGLNGVDQTISAELERRLGKCRRMVKTGGESPLSVFLQRTDAENIKTAVRAISHGIGYEGAEPALVPLPPLDRSACEELCSQATIEGAASLLMTWGHPLGAPLSRFFREAGDNPDLTRMDQALDRAYYQRAFHLLEEESESEREPLEDALRDEIDLANLRMALKVAYSGGGDLPQESISGGRLRAAFLEKMARSPNLATAASLLGQTVFRRVLAEAEAAAKDNDLGATEQVLRAESLRRMGRKSLEDPTGIGFTLKVLAEIFLEAQNLRLAARAAAGLIPTETAREAMIYV